MYFLSTPHYHFTSVSTRKIFFNKFKLVKSYLVVLLLLLTCCTFNNRIEVANSSDTDFIWTLLLAKTIYYEDVIDNFSKKEEERKLFDRISEW